MEFGTLVPQGWRYDLMGVDGAAAKWETFRRVSRGLDEAGWDSLWVWDHFHTFPRKHVETTFEAWTQMATLAEITSNAPRCSAVTQQVSSVHVLLIAWKASSAGASSEHSIVGHMLTRSGSYARSSEHEWQTDS